MWYCTNYYILAMCSITLMQIYFVDMKEKNCLNSCAKLGFYALLEHTNMNMRFEGNFGCFFSSQIPSSDVHVADANK